MRSRFSLLLLSCLVASGCAYLDNAHRHPAEIDDGCGVKLSERNDTATLHHFGEITAPCEGKTAENCCVKKDLDALEHCDVIDIDCPAGNRLLDRLFGDTRHTKFANFIVHFDQGHTPGRFTDHPPILMWNRRNTRFLYGVQEVYILLFTEYKACFTVRGTTLTKSEPNPFAIVLGILGKGAGSADNKTSLVTKPADFVWYPLSGDPDHPAMWLAIASVPVDVNTADWITVSYTQPKPAKEKSDKAPEVPDECVADPANPVTYSGTFLAYNAFFSDNRENHVGVAVAFGGTWTKGQSAPGAATNPYLNGYALAEFYVFRPTLNSNRNQTGGSFKYRPSVGIAVGTNITNSAFNELVAGVSVGHLLGNVGLIAGVNYFLPDVGTTPPPPVVRRRQHRPFFGIEYSF